MNWVLFGVSLVTALLAAIMLLVVRLTTVAQQSRRVVLVRAQTKVHERVALIHDQDGSVAINSSRAPPGRAQQRAQNEDISQHLQKYLSPNDPQ